MRFLALMTARHALGVDLSPNLKKPRFSPEQLRRANADARKIATAEKQQRAYDRAAAFKAILEPQFGDPLKIATGELVIAVPDDDGTQPMLAALGEADQRRRLAATLVADARALTGRERFIHWPVVFPNTWRNLAQPVPDGGFDAIIGNPPYVRQERLAALKPALAASYATYAGTADLYVYFFEQGLRLVQAGWARRFRCNEQMAAISCRSETAMPLFQEFYDAGAEGYGLIFGRVPEHFRTTLLRQARVSTGQTVLDVATGTGIVAEAAAQIIGPSGSVIAVDVSRGMLAVAERRLASLHNVAVKVMDAQALDLPDASVDTITCSLAMMLFPDPAQALREMHRVVRPNGYVSISVLTTPARSLTANIQDVIGRYCPTALPPLKSTPRWAI